MKFNKEQLAYAANVLKWHGDYGSLIENLEDLESDNEYRFILLTRDEGIEEYEQYFYGSLDAALAQANDIVGGTEESYGLYDLVQMKELGFITQIVLDPDPAATALAKVELENKRLRADLTRLYLNYYPDLMTPDNVQSQVDFIANNDPLPTTFAPRFVKRFEPQEGTND